LLWELLLGLSDPCREAVESIYSLYSFDYAPGKKAERVALLHLAVAVLMGDVVMTGARMFPNRPKVISSVATINFVYRSIQREGAAWEDEHIIARARTTVLPDTGNVAADFESRLATYTSQ
jgi:hypothetical protein